MFGALITSSTYPKCFADYNNYFWKPLLKKSWKSIELDSWFLRKVVFRSRDWFIIELTISKVDIAKKLHYLSMERIQRKTSRIILTYITHSTLILHLIGHCVFELCSQNNYTFVVDMKKYNVFKYFNEHSVLNLRLTIKIWNTNVINLKLMNDHMSICSMDNSRWTEALYFLSDFIRYIFLFK